MCRLAGWAIALIRVWNRVAKSAFLSGTRCALRSVRLLAFIPTQFATLYTLEMLYAVSDLSESGCLLSLFILKSGSDLLSNILYSLQMGGGHKEADPFPLNEESNVWRGVGITVANKRHQHKWGSERNWFIRDRATFYLADIAKDGHDGVVIVINH